MQTSERLILVLLSAAETEVGTAFQRNCLRVVRGTLLLSDWGGHFRLGFLRPRLAAAEHHARRCGSPTHPLGALPEKGTHFKRDTCACQVPRRKRDRIQMKEIDPGTEHEYGVLNIVMTGYDMTLVEHYAQYVHKLCNRLSVKVEESYAMPTRTMEVMLAQEQGTKMHLDAVLTTHQRVVQISRLSATFAPILLEVIQSNQPEGVHLLVKEHTETDFKVRLKARPELEELLAQMN
ncbi:hypothetical protein lerEdw1_005835 [Lerista edwardsae]|nr:hypothetical protein lerEdw1_005835 [Lerista edwardsae]